MSRSAALDAVAVKDVFATWSPLRRWVSAVGAAVVVAAVVAEALDAAFWPVTVAMAVTGVSCVAALVVPVRLLWPAGVAAVVASGVLSVAGTLSRHRPEHTPGLVEMAALLLLTARAVRHRPPRRMVPLAAGAWLAAPLALLRLPSGEYSTAVTFGAPPLLLAGALMVVLGAYLRLLDSVRDRERDARLRAQRLEYARDLHDFVGHHITAINAQVKAVRFVTAAGRPLTARELDERLAAVEAAGRQAMESMRAMVGVLRDPGDPAPLSPARHLAGLRELVETGGTAGPDVSLTVDPALTARPLAPDVAATVHRVVQEALTNVRKHACGARRACVEVAPLAGDPGRLVVRVTDDAPGPAAGPGAGFGIVGLTERVTALGGHLSAGPRPGAGWEVRAELPLETPRSPGGDGLAR
ncbi:MULTISPECIES: sensor histidine kinase [Streptomycetaceae]|uniref:histidine kinase n=1 Tax=Streptantibioticus cattleyicolor (strain ATCC 35852 / DSM 46488 / JCM 4925 / NBRC 14057 / NRRL 8057) TaxID=1003195 RepID=F8K1U1_STREN|nr:MULTISPECIES: histidine kinase [Streptomycetaceae]AEW92411.1 histidine kinase [Streptantibioticus cattleyicolor NRRL 8057 = DSM 46488]MYS57221.1 two-component sensor histidine kinase [Streptomyces sp. SID5468]CCB72775.1 Two component sensor kinase MppV [Streptantibioticus cattleyicolor NRRL 8057 = DSM 46488]